MSCKDEVRYIQPGCKFGLTLGRLEIHLNDCQREYLYGKDLPRMSQRDNEITAMVSVWVPEKVRKFHCCVLH